MNLDALQVTELTQGYSHDSTTGSYHCATCGKVYQAGEIYTFQSRFFDAHRAIQLHMETEHPGYTGELLHLDSKYNTLTDNQSALLSLFAAGTPDKDIAKNLGISVSTVRHQKFMFREKAKQARLYLAQYQRVFQQPQGSGVQLVPIHNQAKMVDERYVVTEEERAHILQTAFSSLSPLRLKAFSPKEKKKVVILARIAGELEPGRKYTEAELNTVLKTIFDDFATLRRYLIQYGFMDRTKDGSQYWLTP